MSPPLPSIAPALEDAEVPANAAPGIEMIYRNERQALVRFITRHRSNPEDAGDVAQEAFLRLAQSEQGRSDAILRPRAFLWQIARNLMRNQAKSAAARGERLHVVYDDEAVSDRNEVARLEARDGLARAEAVMRRMKPKTREIFMAVRLDGMSYAEIAERTGMTVSGVEKQMAQAMAMLLKNAGRD
ncbi:RNA polymerase sigma factor [Sphingomonas hengshuiensis]|uniref:RNA polymerase subunit sigma-24 n=1 Tax=Sphingomonas hengshuiensis TaxID=1609977 RepID=A0A7U4JAS8_9SPHN|nr:sigma-70 family RNA polymerase sigma factor [Sphingomonas hengshuiensis]AJP73401.1 hypothetical protein TS85_18815 [Sphingomonas hengshuiensis]